MSLPEGIGSVQGYVRRRLLLLSALLALANALPPLAVQCARAADSGSANPERLLSDREILDVMAFIKARWPIGLRASQAMLNPGRAGMPRQASSEEWRLPPTCNALLRQSGAVTPATNAGATVPAEKAFLGNGEPR